MKKKIALVTRIIGLVIFYCLILVASTFFTMSILIKGDEVTAPELIGKSLNEAYQIASARGIYLKKKWGNYDKNYEPLTIIDQSPSPGIRVKEKSFITVFVISELTEVIVPDLSGLNLRESENIIRKNELKKRYVSYMDSDGVPVDFIIGQSYPAGTRVPMGTEIDLLVSKGRKSKSFIMPDLIGLKAEKVVFFFESRGLKISSITEVPYPGLQPGIIIKQFPSSGFKINSKNLISLQVSK